MKLTICWNNQPRRANSMKYKRNPMAILRRLSIALRLIREIYRHSSYMDYTGPSTKVIILFGQTVRICGLMEPNTPMIRGTECSIRFLHPKVEEFIRVEFNQPTTKEANNMISQFSKDFERATAGLASGEISLDEARYMCWGHAITGILPPTKEGK